MMRRWVAAFLAAAMALCALQALAHKPSDSYLALKVTGKQVDGQWDIALRDLGLLAGAVALSRLASARAG